MSVAQMRDLWVYSVKVDMKVEERMGIQVYFESKTVKELLL